MINDSESFYLKRGEIESESIKALANRGHDIGAPLNNSPRFDGIIKSLHSRKEYGFVDVSTGNGATFDSNPLVDSTKLVKGNRAAIMQGSNSVVEHEKEFGEKCPLVGIHISGNASIHIGCIH